MPCERDGNWREVGTSSQDGGRLMDVSTGILANKKQGQFVTKSQVPEPRPSPGSPSVLIPPVSCSLLLRASIPPVLKSWYFF